ncbi:RRXRR domain-containing protein [Capilliphycus salinus ALCB114379]|uniref:RRXRR domain-containing protein n=1 Tax=Capilliphycus salinus TaxID=2768948 RepID=UPI0039A48011
MPTIPSRARRWVRDGKAKPFWNDLGIWGVQLLIEPSDFQTQDVVVGCDLGKRYSGTAKTRGYIWKGSVQITPAIFKVISKPRITRRRLHDAIPAKGGVRERYGGSTTPFKARKGDLIEYTTKSNGKEKKVTGYCSGYTGKKLSLSDANWSRLGRFANSKCRIIKRNTGLVVSGGLTPAQLPSYPPYDQAIGYGRSTSEV